MVMHVEPLRGFFHQKQNPAFAGLRFVV